MKTTIDNGEGALTRCAAHTFGSPRRLLCVGLVVTCLAGASLTVDLSITQYFIEHDLRGDIHRLVEFSEGFGHGLGVGLIILTVAAFTRCWRPAMVLAIYSLGSGLLCDVGKLMVARHRPYHDVDMNGTLADTFIGWLPWINGVSLEQATSSFPSAHTGTAVGLAIGLSRLYPRATIPFLMFASLAAVQRIDSFAHFVSDVLFGAAVAILFAALLAKPWSVCSRLIQADIREQSPDSDGDFAVTDGKNPAVEQRKCA